MKITINTIQEADKLFERFAVVQTRVAKKKSNLKARIAELKSEAEEEMAEDVAEAKDLEEALKEFCEARKNRVYFTNPKKRKCENGSYGLQCSTEVQTEEGFDAEAESSRLGIELCKRVVTPDLVLIKDALSAGEEVRGAKLQSKETFKYSLKG
jgi:hypothetical protein